jgi:SnoaL-like domain
MSFDPVAALLRYHEAIDCNDIDAVATMLGEDAVYSSGGLGEVRGRGKIVAAMRSYFTDHPDHQSWDDEVIATGPLSARSLWKLKATNKVNGQVVLRHGIEDIEFDASGLIRSVAVKDQT